MLAQEFTRPVLVEMAPEANQGDVPSTFSGLWCDAPNVAVTAFYREHASQLSCTASGLQLVDVGARAEPLDDATLVVEPAVAELVGDAQHGQIAAPLFEHRVELIAQGGVKVNGEKVTDKALRLARGAQAVVQVGKRKFARITIT